MPHVHRYRSCVSTRLNNNTRASSDRCVTNLWPPTLVLRTPSQRAGRSSMPFLTHLEPYHFTNLFIKRETSSINTTSTRNHLSRGSHSASTNIPETLTFCADHVSLSARADSTLSPDHAIAISPLSSASCAHSQTPSTARSSVRQRPSPPAHGRSGENCPRCRTSLAPAFLGCEPAMSLALCCV